jgi:DNA end-binding protein Ku
VPQAIWSGSISFGLIGIPVKLYPATKRNDVRFREVDRATGRRVRHRRVVEGAFEPVEPEHPASTAEDEEHLEPRATLSDDSEPSGPRESRPTPSPEVGEPAQEVSREDLVKGYDLGDDRLVTFTSEELEALRPESTHTIELEEFVDLRDIDPVFYDRSYSVAPQSNVGAEKPYALLLGAMEEAGKIGIGRFVLRTKEHLVALRPMEGVLGLETLFYLDEVRGVTEIPGLPVAVKATERERTLAVQLIETLSAVWSPERYRDPFRERVLELIESKAGTARRPPEEAERAATASVSDLMEALRQSVDAAKEARKDSRASAS